MENRYVNYTTLYIVLVRFELFIDFGAGIGLVIQIPG